MRKIDQRKIQILKYIVEEYLSTGEILWSKNLLKKHDLQVSSATVRNDMASLEDMGLIFQPYNSAGRLPTSRGLRVFVDYLMESSSWLYIEARPCVEQPSEERIDDILYRLISRLTEATREVTFVALPRLYILKYLGLSEHLDKHGLESWFRNILWALETKNSFIEMLVRIAPSNRVTIAIGDENIHPLLQTSTLLTKKIQLGWYEGYLGILGSTMMDYTFNITALRQVL